MPHRTAYHRRVDDPMDAEFLHMRDQDNSKVARYNEIWDRYSKLVIPILWGLVIWFVTKLYPAVNGYPLIMDRLDKADQDRAAMTTSLLILIRMQCLQLDAVDRAKINLNCTDIPLPQIDKLKESIR